MSDSPDVPNLPSLPGNPETPQTPTAPAPTRSEVELDDIAALMGDFVGGGYVAQITRKSPKWCQGFLATWPIDEGFSLSDIREAFGGSSFSIRIKKVDGGGYVKGFTCFIDDIPRRNGRPVNDPDEQPKHAPQIVQNPGPSFGEVLNFLAQANQPAQLAQQQLMTLLMNQLTQAQQAQRPTNQIGDLIGALGQLREVSDLIGGGSEGKDTTASMMEMITGILTAKNKEPQQQQPPQRRTAPPRQIAPPRFAPPTIPQQNPAPPKTTSEEQPHETPTNEEQPQETAPQLVLASDIPENSELDNDEPITPQELAEDLAALPPEQVAETIASYLRISDPETAKVALNALMAAL